MQLLVQKFGGTSVQTEENRQHVIRHIKTALMNGYKVVVVVSALGRRPDPYATDTLLDLVDFPANLTSNRELDMLLSCGETISSVVVANELQNSHIQACALTGAQAGIRTNDQYTQAKITEVKPQRIMEELKTHDVVVVAGFQGMTESGDVTTLGRGGSDTSAAALGVALAAEYVDIFTDVNGIMTADPRMVEKARPLDIVTYSEICNMAYQGAKVIHPRAVEIAMQGKIPLRVRSTYLEEEGTLITTSRNRLIDTAIPDQVVTGIAHIPQLAQITVATAETEAGSQSEIFKAMAEADISVDFINISPSAVKYTIPEAKVKKAVHVLETLGFQPEVAEGCAKVSAVGAGMTGVPGVASKIVQALTEKGVRILQSADSHTTIWILTWESDMKAAVNALHDVFELGAE